jgi:hypothetical protein
VDVGVESFFAFRPLMISEGGKELAENVGDGLGIFRQEGRFESLALDCELFCF